VVEANTMPVIEPNVTEDKLLQLLDEGAESETLDFKETCDLSTREDRVEGAKDVGAMQVDGGYIVVGADSQGRPTGRFTEAQAKLFDEATLRAKLAKWIPEPFELKVAVHHQGGNLFAVVYVGPNPKGCCIFQADGQYMKNGRQVTAFRSGEIFVRRGTASERAQQHDLDRIFVKAEQVWAERARERFAADLQRALAAAQIAQTATSGPAAALTWKVDDATFTGVVIEQLRQDDDIPIRLLTDQMWKDAATLVAAGEGDELGVLLDRLACLAAIGLELDRRSVFERAVWVFTRAYEQGFDAKGVPLLSAAPPRIPAQQLWLAVIERVLAVGALAVRRRDWTAVRDLALQAPRGEDHPNGRIEGHYGNWLRHALTQAARANLLYEIHQGRQVAISLLGRALAHASRLDWLRPDLAADDDRLLSSICQFDLLACVAGISQGKRVGSAFFYPNFARYFASRSEPAVRALLDDPSARAALFPDDDQTLADVLRALDQQAQREGWAFSGWMGFEDPRIVRLLEEHPTRSP
jgi:hypothetical protein